MMSLFRRSATTPGGVSDALVWSLLLADDAWRRNAISEAMLAAWISTTLPPCSLTDVVSHMGALYPGAACISLEEKPSCHFYRRLSRLLDATAALPSSASPEGVLQCIETFGSMSS